MIPETAVLARVYRGSAVEAVHYGSAAVVDAAGELVWYAGDPYVKSMTRSAIKPFQTLALLRTGAADHYGFEPRQLAIMCGSHNGSDAHREAVKGNLERAGFTAADLQCGAHWPIGMEQARVFPAHGEERDPLRHNCSGKHSGFLALAKFLGDPPERYLDPAAKGQALVRRALAEVCEYPEAQMPAGIDGCSAPNYPLPLYNLALGSKKLAATEAAEEGLRGALRRVRDAMLAHPEMVSGEGRIDLDLARSFPGRMVCKIGAEGIEGIGLVDPPLGIAIKIADGSWRAMGAICVAIFRQLGLIDDIMRFPLLGPHENPAVRNARGIVTGRIAAEVVLKRA